MQAFFPGEEGARRDRGGPLRPGQPVGPAAGEPAPSAGAQPYTYLHPPLGEGDEVSNLSTTPAAPFGHGLSYTTFEHSDLTVPTRRCPTDGHIGSSVRVTNTGTGAGADVVQLYAHDLVGLGDPAGGAARSGTSGSTSSPASRSTVTFAVPTTRLAFSDRDLVRVVEPGEVELWVGPSCAERETEARMALTGPVHTVGVDSPRWTAVSVTD